MSCQCLLPSSAHSAPWAINKGASIRLSTEALLLTTAASLVRCAKELGRAATLTWAGSRESQRGLPTAGLQPGLPVLSALSLAALHGPQAKRPRCWLSPPPMAWCQAPHRRRSCYPPSTLCLWGKPPAHWVAGGGGGTCPSSFCPPKLPQLPLPPGSRLFSRQWGRRKGVLCSPGTGPQRQLGRAMG